MTTIIPLVSYILDKLAMGISTAKVCQELLEDHSLPGRAYSRPLRVHCVASLRAQDVVRKKLGCSFKPSLLWFLERQGSKSEWEQLKNCVVQASSVSEARSLAAERAGSEGSKIWLNSRESTCSRLPTENNSRVLAETYLT